MAAPTASSGCATTSLGGQRLHPAQERPGVPVPDQREVVLDQQLGDELVVAGRDRVLGGLDGQAPGPQPVGRAPMGLRHGARLVRGELQLGELREQRVDAIPTAVLEPHHELVGALELGQQRR